MRRPPLQPARPPHAHLQPNSRRLAPTARRRRRAALAAARRPTAATAAAAAAELLGSAPAMLAAAEHIPVRIDVRLLWPPHPAPGAGRGGGRRPRASSGAAREAGWRRAIDGGRRRARLDVVDDVGRHLPDVHWPPPVCHKQERTGRVSEKAEERVTARKGRKRGRVSSPEGRSSRT